MPDGNMHGGDMPGGVMHSGDMSCGDMPSGPCSKVSSAETFYARHQIERSVMLTQMIST